MDAELWMLQACSPLVGVPLTQCWELITSLCPISSTKHKKWGDEERLRGEKIAAIDLGPHVVVIFLLFL